MQEQDYVPMPQNDLAQIEQVAREYSSVPAKGLAHGVQKDAIQNAFGARAKIREVEACKDWAVTFELKQINGKESLVFYDEGTVGLIGEILTPDEIQDRMAVGELGPDERLGRFLARFATGQNVGPGIFGRGKLVFQAASENTSILIDSIREDDGLYIALDRHIRRGQLVQPRKPYTGDAAKDFVSQRTGGVLAPLANPGTRVTIFDLKPEVTEAFRHSFSSQEYLYKASFAYMIEETWWEIIHQFGAKIFLRNGDGEQICVEVHNPLLAILDSKDGEDGIRVHTKPNVPINVGGSQYRMKDIKLVVMPSALEEELRDIWVQRKRMKIGSIIRGLDPHARIAKRLCGYVILEPSLEDLVENAEGLTHYGFDLRANGIRQIRECVRGELREFERKLGLVSTGDDEESTRRLLDSVKDINELATELGLVTQQSIGVKQTDVDILLKEIVLSEKDTLRVEIGDEVGPVVYKVLNRLTTPIIGTFRVNATQRGREATELYRNDCNLEAEESREIKIAPFTVSRARFESGKPLKLEAVYVKSNTTDILAKCSKILYVGIEPPETPQAPVKLSVSCKFPRRDSRRVEASEVIRQMRIRATNNTAHKLAVDLVSTVRHMANTKVGRITIPLFSLWNDQELVLGPQQDYEVFIDDLTISPEKFGRVLETRADVAERTCDIFTVVRLAQGSPEINKPRKWKLDTVSIKFYLEVDPPGHSIFQKLQTVDEPENGKQSWHEGDTESGYTFILNSGHVAFRFVLGRDDPPVVKHYQQERMLRQAYLIAFKNNVFRGPAEPYADDLTDEGLPPNEIAEIFDTIIGTALNKMGG